MNCGSVSEVSLKDLGRLVKQARSRGEECVAVLLEGVEMFVSLGREVELLETMSQFEREIRPAVEGTPSPAELERLYSREDEEAKGKAAEDLSSLE